MGKLQKIELESPGARGNSYARVHRDLGVVEKSVNSIIDEVNKVDGLEVKFGEKIEEALNQINAKLRGLEARVNKEHNFDVDKIKEYIDEELAAKRDVDVHINQKLSDLKHRFEGHGHNIFAILWHTLQSAWKKVFG